MKIVKSQTSKLYYNKYLYKVECRIDNAYAILSRIRRPSTSEWKIHRSWHQVNTQPIMLDFYYKLLPYVSKDIKFRAEGKHFNIFCNEIAIVDELKDKLKTYIFAVHMPFSEEDVGYMLDNGHKKRLCNNLPRDKYKFRVFLRTDTPHDMREKFYKWTENYPDRILLSNATKDWCHSRKHYLQLPFMYVEDGPLISMASLFLGTNIRLIEEFIPRDSINTEHKEN